MKKDYYRLMDMARKAPVVSAGVYVHKDGEIPCDGVLLNKMADVIEKFAIALHEISLCSQNSMSSMNECGKIARKALE